MSDQDDRTFTFRELAFMDEQARRSAIATVKLWAEKYPNLATSTGTDISWRDFWYSLLKNAMSYALGLIALALLWAVVSYIKAGAPPVAGVAH